jgi:hypothetical protein
MTEKMPADQLRDLAARFRYSPVVVATPLRELVPAIIAWVDSVEARLAMIEGTHGVNEFARRLAHEPQPSEPTNAKT